MEQSDVLQVYLQLIGGRCGEDGDAILHALSIANQDPAVVEVQILDAKSQCFEQPEAASIQQACNESMNAGHLRDYMPGLFPREYRRQALGAVRTYDIVDPR